MITIQRRENFTIIVVQEDLVLNDVSVIFKSLRNPESLGMIMDLGEVDVLTSSILANMVSIFRRLEDSSLKWGVTGLNESHMLTLKLAQFHNLFPIFEDQETAIQNLSHAKKIE